MELDPAFIMPAIGTRASLSKTFSEADLMAFASLTGDNSPIHLDARLASRSQYGVRTVHDMLAAGLIAALLHTRLPGPGAVCLSQQLEFLCPILLGDTVTAQVEVTASQPEKHLITLKTNCVNQDNRQVITGQAVLMLLKEVIDV